MLRLTLVLFLLLLMSTTYLFSIDTVQISEVETETEPVYDSDNVVNEIVRDPNPHGRVRTCNRRRCMC